MYWMLVKVLLRKNKNMGELEIDVEKLTLM